jgi:type I restriction enzyme M protein
MADYLQQIDDAKAEIARLKGEKEAFEQSNPPDDADDEELASWNYAKDLDRQVKELKADFKDALKKLTALEKATTKTKATDADRSKAAAARLELRPYFDRMAALEADLAPYEKIKTELAAARATFRTLTKAFVDELKRRCAALSNDEKQALVLELFAQDLHAGLDGAVRDKQQELVRFVENLWDKYAASLTVLSSAREGLSSQLLNALQELGYAY